MKGPKESAKARRRSAAEELGDAGTEDGVGEVANISGTSVKFGSVCDVVRCWT